MTCTCGTAWPEHAQGCLRRVQPGRFRETQAVLDVLTEPLGLANHELPAYGQVPEGCCVTCHGPHQAANRTRCVYCITLEDLHRRIASARVIRKRDRRGACVVILWVIVIAVLILAWIAGGALCPQSRITSRTPGKTPPGGPCWP